MQQGKRTRIRFMVTPVAIGGEDTLGAAAKLYEMGLPVVGVPKTIDNDLEATVITFGFDSAVACATRATLVKVKSSAITARQPSVPNLICDIL